MAHIAPMTKNQREENIEHEMEAGDLYRGYATYT